MGPKEKRLVAYHEVGHALVTALQKDAEPVQKITIVPRTMGSLGYTLQMPEEEKYLETKAELEARLVTYMGGRAAEEIMCDSVTTGASNDIEHGYQNCPCHGYPVWYVRRIWSDGRRICGEQISGRTCSDKLW